MALVKIGKAADLLGVEVQTLRAWEKSGELIPDRRSQGGVRYYDVAKIMGLGSEDMPTIGYARVSSHDQKNDLVRQAELLEAFCAAKGWRNEVISDLGSGMNYRKKGLKRLMEMILRRQMRRLVLTHKDRCCASARSLYSPCVKSRTSRSSSLTKANSRPLRRNWHRTYWK